MLNDYFDRTDEARRHYEIIVNDESMEMSFRSLQVITNFYIRNGEKDKAVQLATRYTDEKLLADMLNKLARNIRRAVPRKNRQNRRQPEHRHVRSVVQHCRNTPSGNRRH